MKVAAGNKIYQSLVCIAVRQGGEKFFLPGTIIRSDGIVATSASLFSCPNSKELSETVDVKVLKTHATYKGVLLDADFCSNIAFVKMMSPEPQTVAMFGNLDKLHPGFWVVAASCHVQHNILCYAEPIYSCGSFGSVANKIANGESHSRTSGAFIRAAVATHVDVLGGPLIDPESGVLGVIYSCDNFYRVKATPIVDVFKNLERLEKHSIEMYYLFCSETVALTTMSSVGNKILKVLRVLDRMVLRMLSKEEFRVLKMLLFHGA
ncbi:hypothetical protein Vadar_026633 [Vaccinium darrowii]|uniref:Uncharacterized protein n=1 Tax=Vaccinium darrowii TaxID=229202 RepID=A0ACB7XKI9_9ERIC|nr:hypothetical protein Vadar_026633 [Vaccinium darrowii]